MAQPYHGPDDGQGIASHGGPGEGGTRSAMEFAEMIVDTVREGLLVLDLDLHIEAANESFYRMFGEEREGVVGRLVYELGNGQWDLPELRDLLERILPERLAFDDFEVEHEFEGVGRRRLLLNARRLNHHQMVLLAIEDVTEQFHARDELERVHLELERANQELEQRVEARTQQVKGLAVKLSGAEQDERQRLAHILHDDLQQQLFGVSIALSLLARAESPEDREGLVERAQQGLAHATKLTRSLSTELSPAVLDTHRLGEVLRWLAVQKRELYGIEVEVEGDADVEEPLHRALLYHLVREVLFNVAKHAGTNRARVVIKEAAGQVAVRIQDEGRGFDATLMEADGRAEGFGLASIRERLELAGGRFEVASVPGVGTRVTLTLPLASGPEG